MTNYKAGDEVTVRGKVAHDANDPWCVRVLFDTLSWADGMAVRADMIATHTPKPPELKVGDVVGLEGAPEHFRWTIIGLHGEWAWLSSSEGAYASAKKIQIVRA